MSNITYPRYKLPDDLNVNSVTASSGFDGDLYGTASFSSDSDKLDGIDSYEFALKTDVTGALEPYALSTDVSSSFVSHTQATASLARLAANNTFTGINTFNGAVTGSNALFTGNLNVNGTASISLLNTVESNHLKVGDKYITILSGANTQAALDGAGMLFGSGSGETPTGDQQSVASILYRNDAADGKIEIFPGLLVTGSVLITSNISASSLTGTLFGTASYSQDSAKLGNVTSSLYALKTDVTGALSNYLTGAVTNGNITGSGTNSNPIILKDTISLTAITASSLIRIDNILLNGQSVTGSGAFSHAEGRYTVAQASGSHSEGRYTLASGEHSHAEGSFTTASNTGAHSEGENTRAAGNYAHAEGYETTASSQYSHAEGWRTKAQGDYSHAEGLSTNASNTTSHAEGQQTLASGVGSHAEGYLSIASNNYSHAEGFTTQATALYAHSEGEQTIASGRSSHAEGYYTTANAQYSHAEGVSTSARFDGSHAEGLGTIASASYQHVQGKYNSTSSTAIMLVGNGTSDIARSNILEVYQSNIFVSGSLTASSFVGALNGTSSYSLDSAKLGKRTKIIL